MTGDGHDGDGGNDAANDNAISQKVNDWMLS
jgi:hypothetical protein